MTTTLITGLPRSGTTFVCACLNTLPDCVALAEPMDPPRHGDVEKGVDQIAAFAVRTRQRLLAEGVAPSKNVSGVIADNFFAEDFSDDQLRRGISSSSDVKIDKILTPNFRLFIKHPALFTALAPHLRKHIPLYAIVRHPLAVLASWQTVRMPASRGRLPSAEAFAPDLRERLDRVGDTLDRQIIVLQWMLRIYRDLPPACVLKYELIVRDPTAALLPLTGSIARVTHPVRISEPSVRYPGVAFARLAMALLKIETDIVPFYPDFRPSLRPYLQ